MRYVAIDIETIGLHPFGGAIWMITVYDGRGKPKTYHDCNGMRACPDEVKKLLTDKSVCKIVHNGEFDLPYIELCWGVHTVNVWDTMVTEKNIIGVTLDDQKITEDAKIKYSASLAYTLRRYGFPAPDKSIRENFINRHKGVAFTKAELKYAADDVLHLLQLQKAQEYLATRDKILEKVLLDNRVVEKICAMRVLGVGVDVKKWLKVADDNLKKYQKACAALPHEVENWNSPKQVKDYFNYNHNIEIDSFKNLMALYIKTRHPVLGQFIITRQMFSDTAGYGKTWLYKDDGTMFVDADGRLRPSYDQNKNTGRFSTYKPNLLGLPRDGLQRSCIVPRKGNAFVIGDFSGQELGIMAAAAKEKLWIDALLRGEDVHALMAYVLNQERWKATKAKGCTYPKKCSCPEHKLQRTPAKESNFLLAYGGGPLKLIERIIKGIFEHGLPSAKEMAMIPDEASAKKFVLRHKKAIRALSRYLFKNGAIATKTRVSYSADPYRSRRVLQGVEDWQVRNQGMNNPIQAAGANMIKLAIVSMPDEFPIILPFHDEIVCDVPKAKAKACFKAMVKIMESSADYITGIHGLIKADVRIQTDYTKH